MQAERHSSRAPPATVTLRNAALSICPADDADQDGHVTINEVMQAVNDALTGCPAG